MQPNVEPVSSSATAVSSSAFTRRRRNPAVLIQWIEEHSHNPYPTKSEKQYLAVYAGMSLRQLNDWFANARRNIKKIGYDLWKKKHTGFSAILSGMPQQSKYTWAYVQIYIYSCFSDKHSCFFPFCMCYGLF